MKVAKYLVKIAGIVLTIVGWFLANHQQYPFIYTIISPKYANAMSAYNKMPVKDFTLQQGDVGFSEISDILKQNITGLRPQVITKITTVGWGSAVVSREKAVRFEEYIDLEISFSDAPAAQGKFYDVKSRIEKMYLTGTVFELRNTLVPGGAEGVCTSHIPALRSAHIKKLGVRPRQVLSLWPLAPAAGAEGTPGVLP